MFKSPKEMSIELAARVRKRRIELNVTQTGLAERSGVSFGSVKRFEQKGEISLKNLLQIAIVLRSSSDFESLFKEQNYTSMDEVIKEKIKGNKRRKRAGRNDS